MDLVGEDEGFGEVELGGISEAYSGLVFCSYWLKGEWSRRILNQKLAFVQRERLIEKQRYLQSVHKRIYLKGPYDEITSVAIHAAFAATTLFLVALGIYNMSHGTGKK
ncbi:Cytochrome c oxidase subunit VII, partial [Dillenia turbinata]